MCKRTSVFFRLFVWEVFVFKKWSRVSRLWVVGSFWAALAACGGGGDDQAQPEQIGPEPSASGMASRYTGTFSDGCGYVSDITYAFTGQAANVRWSIRFKPKSANEVGFEFTEWVYAANDTTCRGEVVGSLTRASSLNAITFVSALQAPLADKTVLAHRGNMIMGPVTSAKADGATMDQVTALTVGTSSLGPLRIENSYLSQAWSSKDLFAVTDEGKFFYTGDQSSLDKDGYPTAFWEVNPWWRQP